MRTWSPASTRRLVRFDPMNPAPPVMRTVRVTPFARSTASGVTWFESSGRPADILDERRRVDPALVLLDAHQHRVDQLFVQEPRPEPKAEEAGVAGVVVVLFHLDPRVGRVLDGHAPAEMLASVLHPF